MTLLTIKDNCKGGICTTAVPVKGPHPFSVHWTLNVLKDLGESELVMQFDPENALKALAYQVQGKFKGKLHLRESPKKSSPSQGSVGNAQQQMQGQARALRQQLEESIGQKITTGNAVSAWLARHSAWILRRFQPYQGGQTPFTRLKGRPYQSKLVQFAEQVLALAPDEKLKGGVCRTAKLEQRWVHGTWLGRTEESDKHLVALQGGLEVQRFRTIKRIGDPKLRFSAKEVLAIKALPWQLKVEEA